MNNKTDKEIALELTNIYVNHLNNQMNNSHQHTDLQFDSLKSVYKDFYTTVSNLGEKKD